MKSMYIHELKSNTKSFVIWILVMGIIVTTAMVKFRGYYNNPEMTKILDAMPRPLLNMFGIHTLDITTLKGLFGILSRYTYLMVSAVGMLWGSGVIAKEEAQKTADFTLTLPLSRRTILTAKALATLTHLVLYVLVSGFIFFVAAYPYHPDATFYYFLAKKLAGMFFLGWIFWALGTCLACTLPKPEQAQNVGIMAVLTLYILAMVQGMHPKLKWLQWLTPFKYFDALYFYRGDPFPLGRLSLLLAIGAMLLGYAYYRYEQRDVYI